MSFFNEITNDTMHNNMKRNLLILLSLAVGFQLYANEPWTVERCMQYAADHGHTVRQQKFSLDDSHAAKTQAIGAFLPNVSGYVNGQLNFGRAIDPETNTYTDVSTLYNGYGLQASLTISMDCNATTSCAWQRQTRPWGAVALKQRKTTWR